MNNEISFWNGFSVHGDTKELDRIVESDGFINLDENDIFQVLSAEGDSCISVGAGTDMSHAFSEAVKSLPCSIDKVNSLLIDFRCGTRQPNMSELSVISATLSETNEGIDVVWGMTSDNSLGESYKVVLLASVKA